MLLKEKLEVFSRIAVQEAMEKYQGIIDGIEAEYNKAIEEAERQAQKKSELAFQTEKYKIEQAKHRETLTVATECKRKLITHRSKLTDEIFSDVVHMLEAFTKEPGYKDYLLKQIKNKIPDYKNCEIKLCSNDMKYAPDIIKMTGAEVSESDEDFIGGFMVILADKRSVYDSSFATGLKAEFKGFNKFKLG